jgi:hypothetical protein
MITMQVGPLDMHSDEPSAAVKWRQSQTLEKGMSETAETILAAAMGLPDGEPEALTIRLIELQPTAGPEVEAVSDAEFAAELLRHKREMEQGVDEGMLWSEVKDMD